jgi:hypothetical protein
VADGNEPTKAQGDFEMNATKTFGQTLAATAAALLMSVALYASAVGPALQQPAQVAPLTHVA